MFIGATGFNISNIAGVLYGDVPLDLTVNQQVCMADVISFSVVLPCHVDMHVSNDKVTCLNRQCCPCLRENQHVPLYCQCCLSRYGLITAQAVLQFLWS